MVMFKNVGRSFAKVAAVLAMGFGLQARAENPLEVAKGETLALPTADTQAFTYSNATVCGTVRQTATSTVNFKAGSVIELAPNDGDEALWTMDGSPELVKLVSPWNGNDKICSFCIGGNVTGGTGKFVLTGTKATVLSDTEAGKAYRTTAWGFSQSRQELRVRAGAKPNGKLSAESAGDDVIDVLELNHGSLAGFREMYNSSVYPARILFNGGTFVFNNSGGARGFSADAGTKYILESVNGNPIAFHNLYGETHVNSYANSVNDQTGCALETRGAGDVDVYGNGDTQSNTWNLRGGIVWNHTGDTILRGCARFLCKTDNILPYGAGRGAVRISTDLNPNDMAKSSWIDLNGKSVCVNSLRITGKGGWIKNSTGTGTLVFGTDDVDGLLEMPRSSGAIAITKNGTGALTVTNTPTLGKFTLKKGTLRFQNTDVTLTSLTASVGTTVVVDGATVSATTLTLPAGVTVTSLNGGRLLLPVQVDADKESCLPSRSKAVNGTAITKTGEGTLRILAGDLISPAFVHVTAGTLAISDCGTFNTFWRLTVKAPEVAGKNLYLGPFRLYNGGLTFCDGGIDNGSGVVYTRVDNTTPAANLQVKQVMFDPLDYTYVQGGTHGSDTYTHPEKAMFNNGAVESCVFNFKPAVDDEKTWLTVTYRIPALPVNNCVYGYDLRTQWDGSTQCYPGTWKLESSPTGEDGTWVVMDEQTGQKTNDGNKWYGRAERNLQYSDNPYPLRNSLIESVGFAPATEVRIDRGATLDCTLVTGKQEISNLTVDLSAGVGVGTLKGVRLAVSGTLNLIGYDGAKEPTGELPLVFEDSVTSGPLENWTILVNGVPAKKRTLVWSAGRLSLVGPGILLLVR